MRKTVASAIIGALIASLVAVYIVPKLPGQKTRTGA